MKTTEAMLKLSAATGRHISVDMIGDNAFAVFAVAKNIGDELEQLAEGNTAEEALANAVRVAREQIKREAATKLSGLGRTRKPKAPAVPVTVDGDAEEEA
jgi:hypothetical protein